MRNVLKTLQRTDKIYAVEVEICAVAVDAVRIEGVTDDCVVRFFIRFHPVALHQTLWRIHLYETVCIYPFVVTVPVDGVGKGMFSLHKVLDVHVAESKPLLLPGYGVVPGSVSVDLRLEQAVDSITEHLESVAVKFVRIKRVVPAVLEALHEAGTHVVGEVAPLEATGHHPLHRLHGGDSEVDGRNINIGALARNKGTDDDGYENKSFQRLFECTDSRGLAETAAACCVGVAVLNVIHKGVCLLREIPAILCCELVSL